MKKDLILNHRDNVPINFILYSAKKLSEDLFSFVSLPHLVFWNTVIFQPQVQENIFTYLEITNNTSCIEPLINVHTSQPDYLNLFNNHNLIFKFLYRLFTVRENDEEFLTQKYHDELLLKYFKKDFRKICTIFKNFPHLNEDLLMKIGSFLKRHSDTFQPHFVNLRGSIMDNVQNFNTCDEERFPKLFHNHVSVLWTVCRTICLIKDDSVLMEPFLDRKFISNLLTFYETVMLYFKRTFNGEFVPGHG